MRILNFGSLNIDFTFLVDHFVKPGQTISSNVAQHAAGGKGLNQSIALARAGASVSHAGIVGSDGVFLKEMLEADGVDCRHLKVTDGETGKAFIQVDPDGQNCIVLFGGTNRENTKEFCDEVLQDFSAGDMLVLQNEINELDYLIDKAGEKGMKVVLNPSPMDGAILACDLNKVSIFLLNEDEGKTLSGETEPEQILSVLTKRYPNAEFVLTLGGDGSVYAHGEERHCQGIFKVEAVDTTGAGDTFTGYFLANYAKGEPIAACMAMAAKASAIAVGRKGAAPAIPYAQEVRLDG